MIIMSRASFSSSPPVSSVLPPSFPSPSSSSIPTNLTPQTTLHTHKLIPRQMQPTGSSSSSSESLSFGFAFMGILLFLLFFAHMMQRVANRRQRRVLGQMSALQDARETEEVPKVWDVKVEGVGRGVREVSEDKEGREEGGDGIHVGGNGARTWVRKGERWKWKDVQPLSADPILLPPEDTNSQPLSSSPHDKLQPLRVAMIIAMPVPSSRPTSTSYTPSTKNVNDSTNDYPDETEDGLPYIELGVTTIK